jgi:hypothetical protein
MGNKDEEKKKVKIIREFVDTRFSEIESEKKEEEQAEQQQDSFSDENSGFTAERTAPVLVANENTAQRLEETVERTPTPPSENTQTSSTDERYIVTYDKTSYTPGGGEERTAPALRQQMRDSGMITRQDEIQASSMVPRRQQISDWHEIDARRNPVSPVITADRLEDEKKLPFEQRKKYKPLR